MKWIIVINKHNFSIEQKTDYLFRHSCAAPHYKHFTLCLCSFSVSFCLWVHRAFSHYHPGSPLQLPVWYIPLQQWAGENGKGTLRFSLMAEAFQPVFRIVINLCIMTLCFLSPPASISLSLPLLLLFLFLIFRKSRVKRYHCGPTLTVSRRTLLTRSMWTIKTRCCIHWPASDIWISGWVTMYDGTRTWDHR